MGVLALGIYLVAVAAMGNAAGFISAATGEGAFVPWVIAVAIIYWIWTATPPPEREGAHLIIGGSLLGIILLRSGQIISDISAAWSDVGALGGSPVPASGGAGGFGSLFGGAGMLSVPGAGGTGGGPAAGPQGFLQGIFPYAQQAASQLQTPVAGILGQYALETGFGTSPAFVNLNNPAGINVAGAATGQNYQSYGSPAEGVAAYTQLIQSQYPGAIGAGTPYEYGLALQQGGYATDPQYAAKLAAVANGPEIQQFLARQGG